MTSKKQAVVSTLKKQELSATTKEYFWDVDEAGSLDESAKRAIFENVLMKNPGGGAGQEGFSLADLANRQSPELRTLNALLLASAAAGRELGYYGCVYRIENKETGQKYVGQTTFPFFMRVGAHIEASRDNGSGAPNLGGPLYSDMLKQGLDKFSVQVVAVAWQERRLSTDAHKSEHENEDESARQAKTRLDDWEREHILAGNTLYLNGAGAGYNRTTGGVGMSDATPEIRAAVNARAAVAKHGPFSLLRQVYVLWLRELGVGVNEISRLAGYKDASSVSKIITGGTSAKALLPSLAKALNDSLERSRGDVADLTQAYLSWVENVVQTDEIYDAVEDKRQVKASPALVEKMRGVLAAQGLANDGEITIRPSAKLPNLARKPLSGGVGNKIRGVRQHEKVRLVQRIQGMWLRDAGMPIPEIVKLYGFNDRVALYKGTRQPETEAGVRALMPSFAECIAHSRKNSPSKPLSEVIEAWAADVLFSDKVLPILRDYALAPTVSPAVEVLDALHDYITQQNEQGQKTGKLDNWTYALQADDWVAPTIVTAQVNGLAASLSQKITGLAFSRPAAEAISIRGKVSATGAEVDMTFVMTHGKVRGIRLSSPNPVSDEEILKEAVALIEAKEKLARLRVKDVPKNQVSKAAGR